MFVSSLTDVGMVRKNNEDSCLVLPPWSGDAIKKQFCAFAIADGMGGENSGEIASHIAVTSVKNWLFKSNVAKLQISDVEEMYGFVNAEIWDYAQKHPESKGMGTTLTFFIIKEDKAIVGHIGDSRLYRLRDGELVQITSDHSIVAEQVKKGLLTPEQARVHPTRHILSRVMGARQFVTPDVFFVDIKINDRFVLFTDGIYGMIEPKDLKRIISENNVNDLPAKLVEAANNAGGKDNATVISIELDKIPIEYPGQFSINRLSEHLKHRGMAGLA